jgi:hypothetical protein
MSAPERRAMVELQGQGFVRRQSALLDLSRSGVYRPKSVTGTEDLAVMRRIDELHLELPCLRLAADDVRTQQGRSPGQPQARAKADARNGRSWPKVPAGVACWNGQRRDRGAGSAPWHEQGRAIAIRNGSRPAILWTQDLSLSAAWADDRRAEPIVGGRHHRHPDGAWLSVSRGGHRLG